MSGIIEKLRLAQSGACTCMTKTPEVSWHDATCLYRVLSEAVEAITMQTSLIASLRAELREAYAIAVDPGHPDGDMTVLSVFERDGESLKLLSLLSSVADRQVVGVVCAASVGGVHCQSIREPGSLFCGRHRSADSRQKRAPLTNEGLAFMMQRDGEQQ